MCRFTAIIINNFIPSGLWPLVTRPISSLLCKHWKAGNGSLGLIQTMCIIMTYNNYYNWVMCPSLIKAKPCNYACNQINSKHWALIWLLYTLPLIIWLTPRIIHSHLWKECRNYDLFYHLHIKLPCSTYMWTGLWTIQLVSKWHTPAHDALERLGRGKIHSHLNGNVTIKTCAH